MARLIACSFPGRLARGVGGSRPRDPKPRRYAVFKAFIKAHGRGGLEYHAAGPHRGEPAAAGYLTSKMVELDMQAQELPTFVVGWKTPLHKHQRRSAMSSWVCTNVRAGGTPCGHVLVVQGLVPPPGVCPKCKKAPKWKKLPALERMGARTPAQMEKPTARLRQARIGKILQGLHMPDLGVGVPAELLKFVREVGMYENKGWVGMAQDEKRVTGRLRVAAAMSINADYLGRSIDPCNADLLDELDKALKVRWKVGGGLFGDQQDYADFARDPHRLMVYAKKGLVDTGRIWKGLDNDVDREKFIYQVYEHEKGYNRIVESLNSWDAGMRPQRGEEPKKLDEAAQVWAGAKNPHWAKRAQGFDMKGTKSVPELANLLGAGLAPQMAGGRWVGKVIQVKGGPKYQLTRYEKGQYEYIQYTGPKAPDYVAK